MSGIGSWLRAVAFGCLAASSVAAQEPRELRLVLIDLVGVTPLVKDAMWREARRLLAPSGVSLHARSASAAEQRDGSELAVILLPERSRGSSRGGPRLGSVHTVATITTIWIDVAAVASVAEAPRGLHCCGVEMRRLGLALGRVLTHELVHFLDPALRHTRGGLMAARVTRETLVDAAAPEVPLQLAKRRSSDSIH